MVANQQILFAETSSEDADPSPPADGADQSSPTDGADPSTSGDDRDDRVRPDRDALRRENRRLRSRVYALERALNEHERRRQAVVDQYELVLDGRERRLERLTDAVRRDAVREDRAAPDGRSTGMLATLRRRLVPPYR